MSHTDVRIDRQLGVLVSVSLAAILVTTQIKPIKRVVDSICGRIYLSTILLLPQTGISLLSSPPPTEDTKDSAVVTGLYTHPVKSLKIVSIQQAVLDIKGFVGDRRYMIVIPAPVPLWGSFGPKDATHRFITQRQCPILTQITVELNEGNKTLVFSSKILPNKSVTISTEPNKDNPKYRSTIWSDIVVVQDMGDEIATFLKSIIQQDKDAPDEYKNATGIRLVVQCQEDGRAADDRFIPGSARALFSGRGPKVALSDGFPILIASEESLDELNKRLIAKGKDALPMSRFRPNIVIRGLGTPFAEDTIKVLKIGDAVLHIVKGCPRCKQSCTDQETGQVTDEPLATLREFRAFNTENAEDLYFAQNALVGTSSVGKTISVGDKVKVLQWGKPVWELE